LAIFDPSGSRTVASSYYNSSQAYLGFDRKNWSFKVNSFEATNRENYLRVYSGTQSMDY